MVDFQLLCHICGDRFERSQIYRHAVVHGIDTDTEAFQLYISNLVCVLNRRNILEMFARKIRHIYECLRIQLIANGFSPTMIPNLEMDLVGSVMVMDLIYHVDVVGEVVEVSNELLERFLFPNWRQLPN